MVATRCQPYVKDELNGEMSKETGLFFTRAEGMALSLYVALRTKGIASQLRFNQTMGQWTIKSDPAHAETTRALFLELLSQERK